MVNIFIFNSINSEVLKIIVAAAFNFNFNAYRGKAIGKYYTALAFVGLLHITDMIAICIIPGVKEQKHCL